MPRKITPLLAALVVLLLAACQPSQPTATPQPSPTPPPSTLPPTPTVGRVPVSRATDPEKSAALRFLVAVPEASAVDIYVESALAANGLTPGVLTDPLALPPDRYQLRIVAAGRGVTSAAILEAGIDLELGESVIFVFSGTPDSFRLARYAEDVSATPPGQARVSFVNALPENVAARAVLNDVPLGSAQSGGIPTAPRLVAAGSRQEARFESGGSTLLTKPINIQVRQAHTLILFRRPDGEADAVIAVSPTRREARMRLIHASQRGDPVDIYLDDRRIADGLSYGAARDWQVLSARGYTLRLRRAGAEATSDPLYTANVLLNPDQSITVAVVDDQRRDGNAIINTVRAQFYTESFEPTKADHALLTVLNAAQQRVTLTVLNPSEPISDFGSIPFGAMSAPVSFSAGTLQLAFNSVGEQRARTIETVPSLTLEAGKNYLYVVLGNFSNKPLLLTTDVGIEPARQPPGTEAEMRIRLINAMLDVPEVDLYVNEARVLQNIRAGQSSPVVGVSSSTRSFRLTAAGGETPLAVGELLFAPNGELTIVAFGRAESGQLLQSIDRTLPSATTAVLRFIHASPDAPVVVIESVLPVSAPPTNRLGPTPTPIRRTVKYVERLEYGSISGPVTLRTGFYTIEARAALDDALIAEASGVQVEVGKRYDLVIVPQTDAGLGSHTLLVIAAQSAQ